MSIVPIAMSLFVTDESFWTLLLAALDKCPKKPLLIGISGPPASGKTSFAGELAGDLTSKGYRATCLTFDGFHYSIADLKRVSEEGKFTFQELTERRGSAVTFDGALASEKFRALQQREGSFIFPMFDHAKKDPAFTNVVSPADHDVIIVEGLYIFLGDIKVQFDSDRFNQVPAGVFPAGIFDFKIRIRCDEQVSRARLIERNGREIFNGDFEYAGVHAGRNDLPNGRFVNFLNDQVEFDVTLQS